jgi:hypothetical protein
MLRHERLQFLGIVAGIIFGVVLFDQQAATFDRLAFKTVMFIEHAAANMWIAPKNSDGLQPGKMISTSAFFEARGTPHVTWAEELRRLTRRARARRAP